VTPIGNTAADSWTACREGRCGIGPITLYDTSSMKVKLAGEVKNLDAEGLLGKRECKKMDRFTQMALIAADQAMAGWLKSEGHRANILNERFTKIGIASKKNNNQYGGYTWEQLFIS